MLRRALFLLLAALLCVGLGRLAIELTPIPVRLNSSGNSALVTIDQYLVKDLKFSSPITNVYLPELEKNKREFHMDGSDGVTYNTFDKDYFETFANHPYYKFQSFLRDEKTYSSWHNVEITNKSPQQFTFSANLLRPELAREVFFTHQDGSLTRIEINRNGKFIGIYSKDPQGKETEQVRWYFPTNSLPFLAEIFHIFAMSMAVVLVLMSLLPFLAHLMPNKFMKVNKNHVEHVILISSLSILFVIPLFLSITLFDKSPYILDGASYFFQAKIFSQGMWTAPAPIVAEAFPLVFSEINQNGWFSFFPPGTAMVLSFGFLLQAPWLTEIVLAVLTALLIFGIGEKLYSRKVALLAVVLFATSPFVHYQAVSFLSHIPALFFATLSLYVYLMYLEKPQKRYVVLATLSLGFTFLIREFTTIIYALTVGSFVLYSAWTEFGFKRIRWDILLAICCLGFSVFMYMLAYNFAFTGSWFEIPRHLGDPRDHWGFGQDVGFFGAHTLASGLGNADQQITTLLFHAFGWPIYFGFAFLFVPLLARKTTTADYLFAAIIAGYILSYIGSYYHGIAFGPRHYFEAMTALVLLTARGFFSLAEYVNHVLRNKHSQTGAAYAVGLVLTILMLCNILYYGPRQLVLYKDFADGHKDLNVSEALQNTLQGRTARVKDAVIISTDWRIYNTYFSYLNCPKLDCSTIYAYAQDEYAKQRLQKVYKGKHFYEAVVKDEVLTLKPL